MRRFYRDASGRCRIDPEPDLPRDPASFATLAALAFWCWVIGGVIAAVIAR
jgi:hypothetical protein